MAFLVKGKTGVRHSGVDWFVGVCQSQSGAEAAVARLNAAAAAKGVLMPEDGSSPHLHYQVRDAAKDALREAGDTGIGYLESNGVRYEFETIKSLD